MPILLILGILLLILLAYLFFSSSVKPSIHVNIDGEMKSIIDAMPSLHKPYRATPWLLGGHMQTLWGMRYRHSPSQCRREIFTFSDGGQCALDFFDPPGNSPDAPIVMIIHTLAGGTREPCSCNFAVAASLAGFRAFVFNNRGCSGVPFTSRRFFCATDIDDLQAVIAHVRRSFPVRFFFLHGFSLGAYKAIVYSIGDGSVDAISCLSHTYNGNRANECLLKPIQRRLYLPIMMTKLKNIFRKNKFVDYPDVFNASTLDEYDEAYTAKEYGITDVHQYYENVSIHNTIGKLRNKTLMIGADNDPFTDPKFQPRKEAEESRNVAFVHLARGGHVSFPMGFVPMKAWHEGVILEYYGVVMEQAPAI
jgi:predicted alpha/beta-fold hydrolase